MSLKKGKKRIKSRKVSSTKSSKVSWKELDIRIEQARQLLREGAPEKSEEICREVLNKMPALGSAWHVLGMAAFQREDHELAISCLEKALRLEPDSAFIHHDLGLVRKSNQQIDDALTHFMRAAELQPTYAMPHYNLGNIFLDQGNYAQALEHYSESLRLKPDNAPVVNNLGASFLGLGDTSRAVECYRDALRLKPDYPVAYCNLGSALKDEGQLEEACECFKTAVKLNPDLFEAWMNLGNLYMDQRRTEEAFETFNMALALNPNSFEANNNLGIIHKKLGNVTQAIDFYQKAIEIRPDDAAANSNLGNIWKDIGDHAKASYFFKRSLSPKLDNLEIQSNLLMGMNYDNNVDPRAIFMEHCKFAEACDALGLSDESLHDNNADPNRCLRIGYVSPDFRYHSVAFFIGHLLEAHDHSQFEVFCYSNVQNPDKVTAGLQKLPVHWRDIAKMNDEQGYQQIKADRIDILVDLAGHTGKNRLGIFARKPAPVQVTYLGYPNTTGLATMDYRLTDAWSDPPGASDRLHTEKLVRLPHGFLCYRPLGDAPEVSGPPILKNGYVTFGSFNNRAKITPQVVSLWSRILQASPQSRIILKSHVLKDERACQSLEDLFTEHGIALDRIDLHGYIASPLEHLRLYDQVDIALDTFPYNGTTTTCEALWMGVPVIVLAGDRHVSRVGMSILSNMGLTELIASTPEDYMQKAVQLAQDQQRLLHLRQNLRAIMSNSSLMNTQQFIDSLETAYRSMWQQWCATQQEYERIFNVGNPSPPVLAASGPTQVRQQAIALNEKAEELFQKGLLELAADTFQCAIQIDPEYVDPYNNLGVLLWHCGEPQEAIRWLAKALQVDPSHETTLNNFESVLAEVRQQNKAASGQQEFAANTVVQQVELPKEPKPTIRILHHMARSGGTIISKCLGCMQDVLMLSEIHPLGTQWFNPIGQANQWFNLFSGEEIEAMKRMNGIPFAEMVRLIHEKCMERDKILLIRDWTHLDFTAVPFLQAPANRLQTAEHLSSLFEVCHTTTVRHPIDQWLSLRSLAVMQGKINVAQFLKGYLHFAEYCQEIGFIRYEDFTANPEEKVQELCQELAIPYDPSFKTNWSNYTTITGDAKSLRGSKSDIKPVPRRPMEAELLEEFESNQDYRQIIRMLGYQHPTSGSVITPKRSAMLAGVADSCTRRLPIKEGKNIVAAGKKITLLDDDIFLASYPGSGNTLMRFLLAAMTHRTPELDFETIERYAPDIYKHSNESLLACQKPRIIKSHEKFNAYFQNVVYLYRDVRDVVVSLYYYLKKNDSASDFDSYLDAFLRGSLYRNLDFGSWSENVQSWLESGNNLVAVRYEDMLERPVESLSRVLDFLSVDATQETISRVVASYAFENMSSIEEKSGDVPCLRKNKHIKFVRRGTTGQWKTELKQRHVNKIKDHYGELLIQLGYETGLDW